MLCGALFFIRSDAFLNWVETRLESELGNWIAEGYTADIGKIKGSIFGNVTIDGVKISKKANLSFRQGALYSNTIGWGC